MSSCRTTHLPGVVGLDYGPSEGLMTERCEAKAGNVKGVAWSQSSQHALERYKKPRKEMEAHNTGRSYDETLHLCLNTYGYAVTTA